MKEAARQQNVNTANEASLHQEWGLMIILIMVKAEARNLLDQLQASINKTNTMDLNVWGITSSERLCSPLHLNITWVNHHSIQGVTEDGKMVTKMWNSVEIWEQTCWSFSTWLVHVHLRSGNELFDESLTGSDVIFSVKCSGWDTSLDNQTTSSTDLRQAAKSWKHSWKWHEYVLKLCC